jgi:hypothetical protein
MRTIAFPTVCVALLSTASNAAPATQPTQAKPVTTAVQVADSTAATPATTARPPTVTAAPADKLICKLLPSSYSHTMQRVCLTKEQWKQVEEQMR